MADYGYGGSSAGELYAHTGQHLGAEISRAFAIHQKDKENLQAVQGLLDIAKRFQTADPKTGKPKNWFSDQQMTDVQRLIDSGNAKAAGAQEAALGIGKGMVDRISGAVARQQMAASGPITTTDASGRRYILNPKTGGWQTDTAMPRNAMGMTPATQMRLQQAASKEQQAQLAAAQKGFRASLKGIGISSPVDLFDTSKHEPGTFDPQAGFAPTSQFMPSQQAQDQAKSAQQQLQAIQNDPQQKASMTPEQMQALQDAAQTPVPPDPTNVRIGYQPPVYSKSGKVEQPGNEGTVISTQDLRTYQDAAAQMAGPQAFQALQWIRNNPDDPLAPKVAKKFRSMIAQPQSPEATTYSEGVAPQSVPSASIPVVPASDTSPEED